MKNNMYGLVAALVLTATAWAVGLNGNLTNAPLAVDSQFKVDLRAAGVNTVAAQSVIAQHSYASKTFKDGQVSVASIYIPEAVSGLSSATATNQITVVSTANLAGAAIAMPGVVLRNGREWRATLSKITTAQAIAAALNGKNGIAASAAGGIVYATAPVAGAYYNSMPLSSNNANLNVANATFTGGRDAATVTINGVRLLQGRDWTVGASSATAAASLAAAINTSTNPLSAFLTATANSPAGDEGVVKLQSKKVGTVYNFGLASNNNTITLSGAAMTGGQDAAWALNTTKIRIASHGLNTGVAVLFSTGSNLAIGGLTDQTTYYVIKVDADHIGLASSKSNAAAGTFITLTSTATPTAAHTYTLAPLAFAAADHTGFKWQVSNDNSTWSDMAVSSVSWKTDGASSKSWDLGRINYRYLRANAVAPTTGAMDLQISVQGSNTY